MTNARTLLATWLGRLGALTLGVVLLVAVGAKVLDPEAFALQIEAEGLARILSARVVVYIALALEAGLGVLLLLLVRRLWVLLSTTALVTFFLAITGRAYWLASRGELPEEAASCGCFGNLVERSPAEAFWQDLLLLGIPLVLAFVGRSEHERFPTWRVAAAALAAAGAVGFAVMAPGLPLDDVATRLRPGTVVADVCAGNDPRVCLPDVAPELLEGVYQVVLADPEESPEIWVEALNELQWSGEGPPLVVLISASSEQLMEFRFTYGPAFEVREAPPTLLRPLYRRLPRSFLVEDGTVTRTTSGLPPSAVPGRDDPNHGD